MEAILLGTLAVACGPLLYVISAKKPQLLRFTQWTTNGLMIYLLLTHVVPDTYEHMGWTSVIWMALGFGFVSAFEILWHKQSDSNCTSIASPLMLFICIGLAGHTLLDGMALFYSDNAANHKFVTGFDHHHDHALGWAVILHRIPVALFITLKTVPINGWKRCFGLLSILASSTVIGFMIANQLHESFQILNKLNTTAHYLQAITIGSLLHIIADPLWHSDKHECHKESFPAP